MNLYKFCLETRNFFEVDIQCGSFSIISGGIALPDFISENQYFRIVGSKFNDGVYKNNPDELGKLIPEDFKGAIWGMAVLPDVIDLVNRISEWEQKYSTILNSPYTSESFDGYSYSKSADKKTSWKSQFASEINSYRRLSIL
jgi:hypothetical protein